MEREQFGIWVTLPCVDNLGSCTYDDLCNYGYSINETCPEQFLNSNVPCRCPFPKVSSKALLQ